MKPEIEQEVIDPEAEPAIEPEVEPEVELDIELKEVQPEYGHEERRGFAGRVTAEKAKAEQLSLEYVVKYRKESEAAKFILKFL